jgi:hypothetical protein
MVKNFRLYDATRKARLSTCVRFQGIVPQGHCSREGHACF